MPERVAQRQRWPRTFRGNVLTPGDADLVPVAKAYALRRSPTLKTPFISSDT